MILCGAKNLHIVLLAVITHLHCTAQTQNILINYRQCYTTTVSTHGKSDNV